MRNTVGFLLLLFLCVKSNIVASPCWDTLGGQLCLLVTNEQCNDLTGYLTLNELPIYGPKTVPIGDILSNIQQRSYEDPNFKNELFCQNLTSTSPFGSCTICATVDGLSIEGDTLNYYGVGQLTCGDSLLGPAFIRNFTIPPVTINNCQLFSCQNDCNGKGKCTSLGMCECDPGFYGYDCLLEMSNNCISGPNFQETCWDFSFPGCKEVEIKITTGGISSIRREGVDDLSSFPIGSCRDVINEENLTCQACLEMKDVTTLGTQLIGCPTLRSVCNEVTVGQNPIGDCITLAQSTQLTCNPDDNKSDQATFSRSKILLTFVSVIIGLGIIGGIFVLLRKYSKFIKGTNRPQVYIEEDEEPLNDDQDSY
jgi:hypothetical protein